MTDGNRERTPRLDGLGTFMLFYTVTLDLLSEHRPDRGHRFKPLAAVYDDMDAQQFIRRIEDEHATPLSRLGSDKYLIAATEATLETPAVLGVAAASAASGHRRFEAWADDETGAVATAFTDAAATEGKHYDEIVAALDERPEPDPDDAVHAVLGEQSGTIERVAAGLVGRGLVRDRAALQTVNFFVNEGDEQWAEHVRDSRAAAKDHCETGASLLASLCESEGDWDRAAAAATAVIQAAYDEYAGALEAMGVDPKPVC